jgi:hypothetical protein
MLSLPPTVRIYLCREPTDMRRGFDGLAGLADAFNYCWTGPATQGRSPSPRSWSGRTLAGWMTPARVAAMLPPQPIGAPCTGTP